MKRICVGWFCTHVAVRTTGLMPEGGLRRAATLGLMIGLLAGAPLRADYAKNGNLQDGLSCWHGDGEATFLKPDGTEGSNTDTDVMPVVKLALDDNQKRAVSQDIDTPDQPTHLTVQVQVYASKDFKRNATSPTYSGVIMKLNPGNGTVSASGSNFAPGSVVYATSQVVPKSDFWIEGGNGQSIWFYKVTNLKPGTWTTLTGVFQKLTPTSDWTVSFGVPPGSGTVYVRNVTVNP